MKSDDPVIWRTWPYTLLFIVIGSAFVAGAYPLAEAHPFWSHVTLEIGIAAVVAGIVGGAIDWLFSKRLAEDVFKATVGYLLPDELRPELHWIYNQKIMCTESQQEYEFQVRADGNVEMVVTSERKLRNISSIPESISVHLGIDEGFLKNFSDILEIGYLLEGEKSSVDLIKTKVYKIRVLPNE